MALPQAFLSQQNFDLALERVLRGSNHDYKRHYRHLWPSFALARRQNLNDLIAEVRRGTYKPAKPRVICQPKKSGVLRPITLLSLPDQVVYQAIANRVAVAFEADQAALVARGRCFGNVFAGAGSKYFFRSWKTAYRRYEAAVRAAYRAGAHVVGEFDVVAFYELIDHSVLLARLRRKVNPEILNLLRRCLVAWASADGDASVGHGIPQGPEASGLLAECLLLGLDAGGYPGAAYIRYVDDVRLLGRTTAAVRRAILELDLAVKRLGLVPQAQKVRCWRARAAGQILRAVPSGLVAATAAPGRLPTAAGQRALLVAFRRCLVGRAPGTAVRDGWEPVLKFALGRLGARSDVLSRIEPLLASRPDLSPAFAGFISRFGRAPRAAEALSRALRQDPVYDAAAADYISALARCAPPGRSAALRRRAAVIAGRSVEKGVALRAAALSFRVRGARPGRVSQLISEEQDPFVRGFALSAAVDADEARLAASLLLRWWADGPPMPRLGSAGLNRSARALMAGLGLRRCAPARRTVLDQFFRDLNGIHVEISWRRALGGDLREAERRCLRVQELATGDPTVRVTMLDTFNELLLQSLSRRHSALAGAFTAAAGRRPQPNHGSWLRNSGVTSLLPAASRWLLQVHEARVEGDLSHARERSTGVPTRPISPRRAASIAKGAAAAWAEMIRAWP